MKSLVLATANQGKAEEFRELLRAAGLPPVDIRTLADYLELPDVEETGVTFAENAMLKARAAWQGTGLPALADDSGLEIDALHGAPGVFSARFAGGERNDDANIGKVLSLMGGIPSAQRGARFQCALALVGFPGLTGEMVSGGEYEVMGSIEGLIITEKRGTMGFGYDPIFYLPGYDLTMAQISPQEKNAISHRARAFAQIMPVLRAYVLG